MWDPAFARLDRWLHLGRYPHEWLSLLPCQHTFLRFCDLTYFAWLVVVPVVVSCVLWSSSPDRCRRYLLTFLGVWILIGSVLAPLLGSVGPIYYSRVVSGPDPYADLTRMLHGTSTAQVKEWLWRSTNANLFTPATGISAMPSVHIGQATLVALLAWTSGRRLVRYLGLAFLLMTHIATVALGWHYAIDGYVSIALTCALYRIASRAGERVEEPSPLLEQTAMQLGTPGGPWGAGSAPAAHKGK